MLVLADLFGRYPDSATRKDDLMQITFNAPANRPGLIYDAVKFPEVKIKPEDVGIDAQTYMLTPVGRRLVQLIVELINFHPMGEITIKAIEMKVTVDTGVDAGEPLEPQQYILLTGIIAHLDNLTPEAFVAIQARKIREFFQNEVGMEWWQNATAQDTASPAGRPAPDWLITKDGSAPS